MKRGVYRRGVWVAAVMGLALIASMGRLAGDTVPTAGLVNYESPHGHPLDLTPDGTTLLAVNTAGHTLEVFALTDGVPVHRATVPVGLDPVSVRARTSTEAWVVNHISDSVSVVDLVRHVVVATLSTDNEPVDVVFAGWPERAFISCADANQLNVIDPAQPALPRLKVAIAGEEPRALAVSPDRRHVYAGIFESGNATTILHGRAGSAANVISRTDGPYGGRNPPPNAGTAFIPPIGQGVGTPPAVSLIVRRHSDGRWLDDNQGDWTPFVSGDLASLSGRQVGWDLPDHDVAMVDAESLAVSYQKSLMTTVMALSVNPVSGAVSAVGTEARNEIRWEPNLNGRFLRVNVATFLPGSSATITDLNPHLDYTTPTVPVAVRTQSIGDPRGMAWRPDGQTALVTGMGSNSVILIDSGGQRLAQVAVGEGPTGVVVETQGTRAYVLNRFGGSVSTVDLATRHESSRVAFYDPTPAVIKAGRPFLYNTHRTSGLGHVSCASCHVDARTDRLAWDLGDPQGTNVTVPNASNATGAPTGGRVTVSAMKGPMATQTLQDIGSHPILHWRGDKASFADFNTSFASLLGAEDPLTAAEMATFKAFLDTIHLPPNPYRALDNSRPSAVTLPDGTEVRSRTMESLRGRNTRNNNCLQCHLGGGSRNRAANVELGQAFVAPSLSLFYKKLGFWPSSRLGSTSGTGFFHDGVDSVGRAARVTISESQPDMLAELMSLEGPDGPLTGNERRQDTHAGVGRQLTLHGPASAADSALLQQLIGIAVASPHASFIAHTRMDGITRGFYLVNATTFQSDLLAERPTVAELVAHATVEPVTFTLVAQGTAFRLAVDRDGDGALDRDGLTLAPPGPQTSALGTPVVLSLVATTLAAPIHWSADRLPAGLVIDATTGVISGTPTAAGKSVVSVTARDAANRSASQAFDWTIDPPQSAPEPGLAAEYFDGTQLDALRLTRIDPDFNVYWPGSTSPGGTVPGDDFSVRWTGRLRPEFSETYTFVVDCDDGVRIWIDGQLILDHWDRAPNTYFGLISRPVALSAGRLHDVRVELQDFFSDAWLVVRWESASQPRHVIPSSRLFRPGVIDTTPPTATLTSANDTVLGPFAVTIIFDEMVTGMEAADFDVSNGSVSAFAGQGTAYAAWITPAAEGVVTIALPAGAVVDAAGLTNPAAGPVHVIFQPPVDNRLPTLATPVPPPAMRGTAVQLVMVATDPDSQNLTFAADGLPAGLLINSSTGLIAGIVRSDAAAAHAVTVHVSDGSLTASVQFPWPIEDAPATAPGLRGEYFGGTAWQQPILTRIDAQPNFYWPGTMAPAPGMPGDAFSVRWTGRMLPAFSEIYQFIVNCDDGVRLWVNGQLLLDHWDAAPSTSFGLASVPIALTAGQWADIRLDLQDFFSDAWIELAWTSARQPMEILPATRFSQPVDAEPGSPMAVTPRSTGLHARYFTGSFLTPAAEHIDPNINFAWGQGAAALGLPADQFSVRWSGWVIPEVSGTHQFHLTADDHVRLWINGTQIVDAWTASDSVRPHVGSAELTAGVPARLVVEYFDNAGTSRVELGWSASGLPRHVIPQDRLSPEQSPPAVTALSPGESGVLAATRLPAIDHIARAALPVVGATLQLGTDPQGGWMVSFDRPPGLDDALRLDWSRDCAEWLPWPDPPSLSITPTGAENVRFPVPAAADDGPSRRFFRVRGR